MSSNEFSAVPNLPKRIYSVWYRHIRVYSANFFSNIFPPFLEPLIMLMALGVGLGTYLNGFEGVSYIAFLASALPVTTAMYSASYECTFGTFIRLEFDRVYDGMLGAPISTTDLMLGEIIFAGTKGLFFSGAVLLVSWITGIITYPLSILTLFVGFLCGIMFGCFSIYITSFVHNINHFNFYFTGFLSPMFFFSGVVFPLDRMPAAIGILAELLPLTHAARLSRAFCLPGIINGEIVKDLLYIIIFIVIFGTVAIRRIRKRLIL